VRISILIIPAVAMLAAVSACADDLTFSLNSSFGSGYSTNLPPDSDTCLQPNCVLFAGTLTDNDTDQSFIFLNDIGVVFSTDPAVGSLAIDNTFFDEVPGVLSGDPDFADDGNPANTYSGPIFGIDIAPGTAAGTYQGLVTIDAVGGTGDPNDNGFTVQQNITVEVTPEPNAGSLLFAGVVSFALWRGVRRKWLSCEARP
jgi:hypothetical protein